MNGESSTGKPLSRGRRKLLLSLRHKKHRVATGLFLVEGVRGVAEALKRGLVKELYLSRGKTINDPDIRGEPGVPVMEVAEDDFRRIAQTVTPQGIAALCRLPAWRRDDIRLGDGPVLIIDGVQDPGNLGSILRTGWALGAGGAVVGPGSADPFSPGSVRGSMGALFNLPVISAPDLPAELKRLKDEGCTVYAADPGGELDLSGLDSVSRRSAVILGNEARGPSSSLAALADHSLRIPQDEGAGSINVAAATAILLYHFQSIAATPQPRR